MSSPQMSSSAQSAQAKVQTHPAYLTAKDKTNHYLGQLDKELTKYPILNHAEARTQVPKTYLVLGGGALVMLLHSINVLAMPVSNLVGLVLPAYLSLKAIETPGHQDDIQYLTYWVVFGFLNFLESFALSLVLYYFPWYFAFKSVFVLWLQLPAFRGAQKLYEAAFRPALAGVTHSQRGVVPVSDPASSIPHME